MTKTTKNNFITCGITLGLFVIFGVLAMTGVLGSQYSGLLIPIGIYIILSISLNLTVGILGELSLGHAGFMCIGAYVGGIFSLITEESINPSCTDSRRYRSGDIRYTHRYPGTETPRRLPRYRNSRIR